MSSWALVARKLAAIADVVIETFRPDILTRWQLGYDILSGDNPGLILARVTEFGQVGPYRRRPGFGTLAEAMSGFAAFAVTAALNARRINGHGQVVDLASSNQ